MQTQNSLFLIAIPKEWWETIYQLEKALLAMLRNFCKNFNQYISIVSEEEEDITVIHIHNNKDIDIISFS